MPDNWSLLVLVLNRTRRFMLAWSVWGPSRVWFYVLVLWKSSSRKLHIPDWIMPFYPTWSNSKLIGLQLWYIYWCSWFGSGGVNLFSAEILLLLLVGFAQSQVWGYMVCLVQSLTSYHALICIIWNYILHWFILKSWIVTSEFYQFKNARQQKIGYIEMLNTNQQAVCGIEPSSSEW